LLNHSHFNTRFVFLVPFVSSIAGSRTSWRIRAIQLCMTNARRSRCTITANRSNIRKRALEPGSANGVVGICACRIDSRCPRLVIAGHMTKTRQHECRPCENFACVMVSIVVVVLSFSHVAFLWNCRGVLSVFQYRGISHHLPRRETLNSLKMAVAAIKAYVEYISPSHQPTTRRHGRVQTLFTCTAAADRLRRRAWCDGGRRCCWCR
jgi:hypothetical protein